MITILRSSRYWPCLRIAPVSIRKLEATEVDPRIIGTPGPCLDKHFAERRIFLQCIRLLGITEQQIPSCLRCQLEDRLGLTGPGNQQDAIGRALSTSCPLEQHSVAGAIDRQGLQRQLPLQFFPIGVG
ncbi:hypothetical protein BC89_19835 [Pseudomonas monteilii]|nr:hypothetical protein BC89_19835 [Pseudomonas monteilii]